jgi:hypothetical protein
MLTHQLWQSHFAGRQDVIGRSVSLDGRGFTEAVSVLEPPTLWAEAIAVIPPPSAVSQPELHSRVTAPKWKASRRGWRRISGREQSIRHRPSAYPRPLRGQQPAGHPGALRSHHVRFAHRMRQCRKSVPDAHRRPHSRNRIAGRHRRHGRADHPTDARGEFCRSRIGRRPRPRSGRCRNAGHEQPDRRGCDARQWGESERRGVAVRARSHGSLRHYLWARSRNAVRARRPTFASRKANPAPAESVRIAGEPCWSSRSSRWL